MNRFYQILAHVFYVLGSLVERSMCLQRYMYEKFMVLSADLDVFDEVWEKPKPNSNWWEHD